MELEIKNPDGYELTDFLTSYLFPKIEGIFSYAVDSKRALPIEEYINSLNISPFRIRVADIIAEAGRNLSWEEERDGSVIVSIDNDVLYGNTNTKLYDLVQLIEYGTLSTPAYPVVSEVFETVAKMMGIYSEEYLYRLGFEDNDVEFQGEQGAEE